MYKALDYQRAVRNEIETSYPGVAQIPDLYRRLEFYTQLENDFQKSPDLSIKQLVNLGAGRLLKSQFTLSISKLTQMVFAYYIYAYPDEEYNFMFIEWVKEMMSHEMGIRKEDISNMNVDYSDIVRWTQQKESLPESVKSIMFYMMGVIMRYYRSVTGDLGYEPHIFGDILRLTDKKDIVGMYEMNDSFNFNDAKYVFENIPLNQLRDRIFNMMTEKGYFLEDQI